jgi:hypothetical protein
MQAIRISGRAISAVMLAFTVGCGSDDGSDKNPIQMPPPTQMQPPPMGVPMAGTGSEPMGGDPPMGMDPTDPPDTMGGTAGSGAPPDVTDPPPDGTPPELADPRGSCPDLNSGYPDDHACIKAPEPGEGMQIHVGPTNYDDPAEIAKFSFAPGMESSECWTYHTPNTEDINYNQGNFVISGRAGTHHIISTMYNIELTDGGFSGCQDPGTGTNANILDTLPGASRAYMARRLIAPENVSVGRLIPANTPSQSDMHYFNFTDEPLLREFWMNIYFVPNDQVEEQAHLIRGMGGLEWLFPGIAPGEDHVYQYQAPIEADGRIIELLGHYHSHGVRFTAYLKRGSGEQLKVFEMYDYQDPLTFSYDSIAKNPEFSSNAGGAYSGILEVKAGDTLQWECHIVNDDAGPLNYTNNVKTGEMCNIWGATVGPIINMVVPGENPF